MIAWVDLETTGLNPNMDYILEIGFILTDDELNELARTAVVVGQPSRQWDWMMPPVVRDMHEKSGLADEINAGGYRPGMRHVEMDLVVWLRAHDVEEKKVPLGGSTVSFDRSFLQVRTPLLFDHFDYHDIDVSSLREVCRRWYPDTPLPEKRNLHRVIPDLEDTLSDLRHYRAHIFK